MKKILITTIALFTFIFSIQSQERFVYELEFEPAQTASSIEAEKMFFHFYDGFKKSEKCLSVKALQHHTGKGYTYKILAYTASFDDIDDMMVDAQTYFSKVYPEMMTNPWPMAHTGDAIYAVRSSADEGYITK